MALLTRSPAETRLSVEEYLKIASRPEYADCRVELVEGEIVTMPPPQAFHGVVLGRLFARLFAFVEARSLGYATAGDAGFLLDRDEIHGDTVRGMDITFISRDKIPGSFPRGLLEIAPDLAIEVMSPSNTVSDTNLKIEQLLQAGCAQVWIVHPDLCRVDVHNMDGMRIYREGDTLAAPGILPGFEIAVADIFPS
ncbi:MAG: Uma2 family endonuclease [Chloroflexi bacterium]|nr:Uma2 family endonuclease [Chloroflexota bacterium]